MQSTQKLIRLLRSLTTLLEEEASQNPAFAEKLEALTAELPSGKGKKAVRGPTKNSFENVPDVIGALQEKGETEFRFWLRSLDLPTLKSMVKANGFDPAKASKRWTEADKFVALIAEQSCARLRRGSGFLTTKTSDPS